jgi:hypothetical protein
VRAGGTQAIAHTADVHNQAWLDLCPNPALVDVGRRTIQGLSFACRAVDIDTLIPSDTLITHLTAYREAILADDATAAGLRRLPCLTPLEVLAKVLLRTVESVTAESPRVLWTPVVSLGAGPPPGASPRSSGLVGLGVFIRHDGSSLASGHVADDCDRGQCTHERDALWITPSGVIRAGVYAP